MNILYPKNNIYSNLQKANSLIREQNHISYNESLIEAGNSIDLSLQELISHDFSQALSNYRNKTNKAFPVLEWYQWKDYEPLDLVNILNFTYPPLFNKVLGEILYVDENTRSNSGASLQILFRNHHYEFLDANKLTIEQFQEKLLNNFFEIFNTKLEDINENISFSFNTRLRQWWSIQMGNPNISKLSNEYWNNMNKDTQNHIFENFVKSQHLEKGPFIPVLERYLKQNYNDNALNMMVNHLLDKKTNAPTDIRQRMLKLKIEHDLKFYTKQRIKPN